MSTGDDHATHDSGAWEDEIVETEIVDDRPLGEEYLDLNIRVREEYGSRVRDINTQWPQQHIEVGEIYQHLSPESANRILSMVEREQDYEKRARRTALWLTIFGWAASAAGLIAAFVGILLIGLHSKSSVPSSILSAGAGGGAVIALLMMRRESRESRLTFHHRDDETSDDSHQDVR